MHKIQEPYHTGQTTRIPCATFGGPEWLEGCIIKMVLKISLWSIKGRGNLYVTDTVLLNLVLIDVLVLNTD